MGNTRSLPTEDEHEDIWWTNRSERRQPEGAALSAEDAESLEERTNHRNRLKEELDEFKLELARKHERRRQIIAEKHKEMQDLRDEVQRLKNENDELRSGNRNNAEQTSTDAAIDDIKAKNLELKMTIAGMQKDLQDLNAEVVNFEKEREDYKAHVVALKDVVSVSKQMLLIRESQLKELREKVKEIETSLAGRELTVLSQDLREEYEKQLQNIRNLRTHYEERQRADKKEKEELHRVLEEVKKELGDERAKNSELVENNARLEEENSRKYDEIKSLESNLGLTRAECGQFQSELAAINQLFAQTLLDFDNSQGFNIDKLTGLLQENHHLLQDIATNEDSTQVSALPKVLLDLVNEVKNKDSKQSKSEDLQENAPENASTDGLDAPTTSHQLNSASEIVENLPKVWKVLIELLSHQSAPIEEQKNDNPCYNVVETAKGPSLVLSVSKTFIHLKDLILEKKSLERETNRLKHLNTHLECRLQEQEKRLEMVSSELSETWHVVGKLQKKHHLLHTQEKILRYELAQKRKLLTELKQELEYSREKCLEAREKNSTTEKQWKQLRIEFAARKNGNCDDCNNSVESGYSDDKECSSEDEPGYETDVSEGNQKSLSEDQQQPTETQIVQVVREEIEAISSELKTEEEVVGEKTQTESCSAGEEAAGSSSTSSDFDRAVAAREERLRRLEGQCSSLFKQVSDTTSRSTAIANKLDALHEIYGERSGEAGEGSNEDQEEEKEEGGRDLE